MRVDLNSWLSYAFIYEQGIDIRDVLYFLWLAVLENVVFDEHTREVDYADKSVTGNMFTINPTQYSMTWICSYREIYLEV